MKFNKVLLARNKIYEIVIPNPNAGEDPVKGNLLRITSLGVYSWWSTGHTEFSLLPSITYDSGWTMEDLIQYKVFKLSFLWFSLVLVREDILRASQPEKKIRKKRVSKKK